MDSLIHSGDSILLSILLESQYPDRIRHFLIIKSSSSSLIRGNSKEESFSGGGGRRRRPKKLVRSGKRCGRYSILGIDQEEIVNSNDDDVTKASSSSSSFVTPAAASAAAEAATDSPKTVNSKFSIGFYLCPSDHADLEFRLNGDGGFSLFLGRGSWGVDSSRPHNHWIFKPVSVQALWTAIQTLSLITRQQSTPSNHDYNSEFSSSESHHDEYEDDNDESTLTSFASPSSSFMEYKITSSQSCLNEWNQMEDLLVKRPPSPHRRIRSQHSSQKQEDEEEKVVAGELNQDVHTLIGIQLRRIMKSLDLDKMTSKFIRTKLESEIGKNLEEFKSFIDSEILLVLGQMDPASKILDYLYLGSEWNANNLEELRANGITHILNVTREIDNFFPALFTYRNIRVYDEEATDLLKWFDETYKFIKMCKDSGGKVLVHCKMGISRSATVTISYIMKEYQRNLEDTVFHVKERRDIINPNKAFVKQLEVYEGILNAIRNRHNGLFRSKSESSLKKGGGGSGGGGGRKRWDGADKIDENHEVKDTYRKNSRHRTTIVNVKALVANVFSRPNSDPLISSSDRPKSWSPNEKLTSELLRSSKVSVDSTSSDPANKEHVELELRVPHKPVKVHEHDSETDYIIRDISDVNMKCRLINNHHYYDANTGIASTSSSGESRESRESKEELSVKIIANMFDFKESSPASSTASGSSINSKQKTIPNKLEDSLLFKKAQKINHNST